MCGSDTGVRSFESYSKHGVSRWRSPPRQGSEKVDGTTGVEGLGRKRHPGTDVTHSTGSTAPGTVGPDLLVQRGSVPVDSRDCNWNYKKVNER